jgi:Ni/Co efflux regulator RcnB
LHFINKISGGNNMRKFLAMLVAAVFAAASLTAVAAEGTGGDAPKASAKKSDKSKKPAKAKKSSKKPAKSK